jgi:predicted ester cyclase
MTDDLAAFYRRYNAACNEHRFDDFAEFVSPDVTINDDGHGLEDYTSGLRAVVAGFPDFRWELRHLLVNEPWVGAHLRDTGTHRGAYLGVEASGRSITSDELAFYRIEAGRIAEVWGTPFHAHLVEQITR